MAKNDFTQDELSSLDWSQPDKALSQVYRYAIDRAHDVEGWYQGKRQPKRIGGQVLRVSATALATIAALIPILAEIYTNDGKPGVPPGWASVALVLAAALIGLDRYFGFSTGWIRFMEAQQKVEVLRRKFEFEWQEARMPERTRGVAEMLGLAQKFIVAVDEVIKAETEAWAIEFKAGLDSALRNLSEPQGENQRAT